MKTLRLLTLIALLPWTAAHAQLQDDFSDGNFTENPTWLGDTARFTVTNEELQLLDTDPASNNTSVLYTFAPTSTESLTTWEVYVRLAFDPSASNYARIYLAADLPSLAGEVEGYYLRIGGISGPDDAVELFRQDGSSSELLISGETGVVGTAPAIARLRVTRSTEGEWTLLADYDGGTDYALQGSAQDNTYPTGNFFGWACYYTSTRATAFFLDDVLADPLIEDTQPPGLVSVAADDALTITVQFDEPLDPATASEPSNYSIDNNIGAPIAADLQNGLTQVVLTLGEPLQSTITYTLTASGIQDLGGNTAPSLNGSFTYYEFETPLFQDVIISEMMPDPTPPVSLPNAEYVELYNRSGKIINLSSLQLSSGGSPQPLPNYILFPEAYVTVCGSSFEAEFAALGPTVAIPSFPSLVNSADEVLLLDESGELVFEVSYTDQWYETPDKGDGGYSLELIQLDGPYDCTYNWRASESPSGGTPGQPNSLLGAAVRSTPPSLRRVVPENGLEIRLLFDAIMDEATAGDPANYSLSPALPVVDVLLLEGNTQALLVLSEEMTDGASYELSLAAPISDCIGNRFELSAFDFTYYETELPLPEDVIISEIMPDPNPPVGLPNAEYAELHNRSDKAINLANVRLASGSNINTLPPYILQPGAYVAICSQAFEQDFAPFGPALGIPSFPRLTIGGDNIRLTDLSNETLVEVNYTDQWYETPGRMGDGYSLELIQLEGPYDCPANWRATESELGGTPGQPNSLLGATISTTPPDALRATLSSELEIRLLFTTPMDVATAADPANYSLSPALPITNAQMADNNTAVILTLGEALSEGTSYELTVAPEVADCIGNGIEGRRVLIGIPEGAQAGDLIINELLFWPESGAGRFVEIYNPSGKIINLFGLELINTAKLTGTVRTSVNDPLLIFPGDYLVLADDPAQVRSRYTVPRPDWLLQQSIPTLDNDEGNITLRLAGVTIDAFDYSRDYHYQLLKDQRGVSLERLSPNQPASNPGNWHSAAATAGFATPTGPNSQRFERPGELPNIIDLPRNRFSPDEDGFEDVLLIDYATGQPGYTLNLWVFDANGREIARLANNEILGNSGTLKWDGTAADGSRARIGIYALLFELFTPDGAVEREKRAVVLAGQLD